MSSNLRIHEPLGERAATLPLVLGGEHSDIALPGFETGSLRLAASGRQWVLHPAADAAASVNGVVLRDATVLDDGDVIRAGEGIVIVWPRQSRIEVLHLAGNQTVAPLRQDVLPGEEVVAGVREIFAAGAAGESGRGGVAAVRGRRRPWLLATGALAAMLLLAFGGFLFALVAVPVQLAPEGTRAKVVDSFSWQSADRVFLLPGLRTVEFSHPGHHTRTLQLEVSRALAEASALQVDLPLLPGILEVDTGGIEGELLVEGRVAGKVPGDVEVEAGTHDLILRAPRHVDHLVRLTVEGGGERQQLAATLQSSIGWLALDTAPEGARVSIDGEAVGETPLRLELDSGLRTLAVSAPGRRTWSSQVAIIAGETLDLGRINLAVPPPPRVAAIQPASPSGPGAGEMEDAGEAKPEPVAARPPPPARLRSDLLGTLVLMPAGKYVQGSDRREQGRRSNEVQREVTLTRAFYLAESEVTNAQFRVFRKDHVSGIAMDKSLDLDPQPVSNVSWNDAIEFCNWLSLREGLPAAYERREGRWQLVLPHNRGYRLPTEAEWEYAARFADGRRTRRYAWGDALPPPEGAANLAGTESLPARNGPDVRLASALPNYVDQHAVAAPVGSYARSAAGFFDMGGNLSEWTHDVYSSLPEQGAVTDPMGVAQDGPHSIRGPNWRTSAIAELRLAWRDRASQPAQTIGFRVARFAEDLP